MVDEDKDSKKKSAEGKEAAKPQKKENKPSQSQHDDSDQNDEEKLEYIKRKEDQDGDVKKTPKMEQEKTKKEAVKKETETQSQEPTEEDKKSKEKSLAQEIREAMAEKPENLDNENQLFRERDFEEKKYSMWNLDLWLKDYFSEFHWSIAFLIETLVFGLILFLPSSYWIYKEWDNIKLKKYFQNPGYLKFGELESLFRLALFTFCWCVFDSFVSLICDSTIGIFSTILKSLQLSESEFIWSLVLTLFELRAYLRFFIVSLFVFYLSKRMFDPFNKPKSFDFTDPDTYKLLLMWAGIYSGLHFVAKFLLSILLYDIKRSSYKDTILDLNYKLFIFKKLDMIAEASTSSDKKDICESEQPSFDPGFYLKDSDFFLSEEDAGIVANNILVNLKKNKLEIEDFKEYFPNDYELVYTYLTDSESIEDAKFLTAKTFINRAKELYLKRKDMQKTLIDRDYIFNMLDSLVHVVVLYVALIILCLIFEINYKVYLVGFGSTLLTFSWIFADTIKKIFICFVFVLLIRPYEIGDRVVITNEILKVQKINLLHTTFLNRNKSVIYLANDFLFSAPIINFARSSMQCIEIEITPNNQVTLNEAKKIEEAARSKIQEISKYFSNLEMNLKTDAKVGFLVYLKRNLQDEASLNRRKSTLMKIFDDVMEEVGVPHKSSYVFKP